MVKLTTLPNPEYNDPPRNRGAWRDEPATARQIRYLADLLKRHDADALGPIPTNPSKGIISDAIKWVQRRPARRAPAKAPSAPAQSTTLPEGTFVLTTEHGSLYVRIKRAVHGSGELYAQQWLERKDTDNPTGRWVYHPQLKRVIIRAQLTNPDALQPLTEAEASAFGHLYGQCVNCGRTLTDDRSIKNGYGSTCAANQGWEW